MDMGTWKRRSRGFPGPTEASSQSLTDVTKARIVDVHTAGLPAKRRQITPILSHKIVRPVRRRFERERVLHEIDFVGVLVKMAEKPPRISWKRQYIR